MAAATSVEPTPVAKARQAAVGAGVGVRPQHHVARSHQAQLRQQGVLHAHVAALVVVGDAHGPVREVAHHLDLLGRVDVLVGHEVVADQGDPCPCRTPRSRPWPPWTRDGQGGGDVVGQHQRLVLQLPRSGRRAVISWSQCAPADIFWAKVWGIRLVSSLISWPGGSSALMKALALATMTSLVRAAAHGLVGRPSSRRTVTVALGVRAPPVMALT